MASAGIEWGRSRPAQPEIATEKPTRCWARYTGDFRERGIKEAHGYMAEYAVDQERDIVLVPPDLREIAVLTEPLTIAEKALSQISWMMQQRPPWLDPRTPSEQRGRGLSALVLGIGPVGLLGAMVLAGAGFTTYVYSRELPPSPRIDLVAAIGATYLSSQATTFAELADQVGNIDLVYDAVGHSHFALEALQVLGTNGIFVLTGVPGMQAFVEADPARLMRDMVLKNQVVLGTVNAGADRPASRDEGPGVTGSLAGSQALPRKSGLTLGHPTPAEARARCQGQWAVWHAPTISHRPATVDSPVGLRVRWRCGRAGDRRRKPATGWLRRRPTHGPRSREHAASSTPRPR